MAHELDRNQVTGKRAMFSVKETPWHREGVILNEAPTFEDAMKLAGCDYEVATRPVFVCEADGTTFTKSATGQAIVRLDRQTTLGEAVLKVVGDDYVPVQNRDAFGVLEPLLDKGVAHLETGGTLRGGRDAWMMVRFDVSDPVVQEVFADEVVPFGLITNHSGEARVLLMETPIRVVCANTLGAALVGWKDRATGVSVAHTGAARVKVVEAAEQLFGKIVERYRTIAEQYRAMKSRILTVEEFVKSVLDTASPLPKDLHGYETEHLTVRGYDLARKRAEERRAAIQAAWTGGKGHAGDHSAWEAYNGAVEVIDHDATLYRTNGSRVASLLGGRLLEAKSAVLNNVAVLCGVTKGERN